MDFSSWNWAASFRLHEAACLIAGVMPISKRQPTSEELPPQARPPLIKLASAYYEWFLQAKNPERPKSIVLEGCLNADGSLPPLPSVAAVTGEIVSREAIHKFLALMAKDGLTSCYDFGPIGKAGSPLGVSPHPQSVPEREAAAPAPTTDIASNETVVPYKKAALIAAHIHEWPTIVRDIADANTNGLADAAKAGKRGWREADALRWARANGKLISATKPADSLAQAMHNLGTMPSLKHTMQG